MRVEAPQYDAVLVRVREEARAGGFKPPLVNVDHPWGRPDVRGAKKTVPLRQNRVLEGVLDLLKVASSRGGPFF